MSSPIFTHLMFDIETLGTRERSVVLTLACVPFTFEDVSETYDDIIANGFFVKFDAKEQIKTFQRVTDADTIAWWKNQSDEAKRFSLPPSADDVSLEKGCADLRAFIKGTNYDFKNSYIWSRGCYFDFPKIEDLYRDLNQKAPFNGFKIRDTRTMIDVLTGNMRGEYDLRDGMPTNYIKHHALHDAAFEAVRMKEIFNS